MDQQHSPETRVQEPHMPLEDRQRIMKLQPPTRDIALRGYMNALEILAEPKPAPETTAQREAIFSD